MIHAVAAQTKSSLRSWTHVGKNCKKLQERRGLKAYQWASIGPRGHNQRHKKAYLHLRDPAAAPWGCSTCDLQTSAGLRCSFRWLGPLYLHASLWWRPDVKKWHWPVGWFFMGWALDGTFTYWGGNPPASAPTQTKRVPICFFSKQASICILVKTWIWSVAELWGKNWDTDVRAHVTY